MDEQNQQPAQQPDKPKKKFYKKWWFWVIIIVFLVLSLFIYYKTYYGDYFIKKTDNYCLSTFEDTGVCPEDKCEIRCGSGSYFDFGGCPISCGQKLEY